MVLGKLDRYMQKNETRPPSYTTCKSKFKMDSSLVGSEMCIRDRHNSYQHPNDVFHRTRTNISKIYMEPQKALHSNGDPEKKEQSWRNHAT